MTTENINQRIERIAMTWARNRSNWDWLNVQHGTCFKAPLVVFDGAKNQQREHVIFRFEHGHYCGVPMIRVVCEGRVYAMRRKNEPAMPLRRALALVTFQGLMIDDMALEIVWNKLADAPEGKVADLLLKQWVAVVVAEFIDEAISRAKKFTAMGGLEACIQNGSTKKK